MDCLDKAFVQKLGKLDKIQRFEHQKYAQSFNGKRTEILGHIDLTLKVADRVYRNMHWYVLDLDGKFNAILGAPFFDRHGLTRTLDEQVALIFGQKPHTESTF